MKKLTKEQSEWLIEKVKKEQHRFCPDSDYVQSISKHHTEHLEKIIDQCTEKEFPEFKVEDSYLEVKWVEDDEGYNLMIKSYLTNIRLNNKQFLQFAEGVAKVAEWMRENE